MRVHGGDGIHEDEVFLHHPLNGAGGGGLPGPSGPLGQVLTAGPADGLTHRGAISSGVFRNATDH